LTGWRPRQPPKNMHTTDKPRLMFFRYKVSQHLPEFLLIHRIEHLKCLSESFNVTVIDDDCNYDEICDKYCPNLTLFETGLNLANSRRLSVLHTHTHAAIPKLGFVNADAWCETRSGTLSEMDQWGIDTLFSISTTAAEHIPEIADKLFFWPPFIDTDTYHDYGERKLIPIVLTGSQDPQYPWRRRVYRRLSENYPSLLCPHGGYLARSRELQVMYGEHYARTLNASLLVPACGTVAKEVVRKHFEIPGCKACLLTEASAALKAAGFVDMKNCVFADEWDVLDKLEHLFKNPKALTDITQAGYELVRSRHTLRHRSQILQWYTLNKELRPDQKIIQSNPFGALTLTDRSSGSPTLPGALNGLHLALIRDGDEALSAGNFQKARQLYQKCLNYMCRLPEAKVKLALCSLYQGQAERAAAWIWEPIKYILAEYKAIDPDPTEWAYYIIALLCQGKLQAARRCAAEFSWLCHPELDRARWVVKVLANNDDIGLSTSDSRGRYRASIHRLPERNTQKWIEDLCRMLEACGQDHFVKVLRTKIVVDVLQRDDQECSRYSKKGLVAENAAQKYERRLAHKMVFHARARVSARVIEYQIMGHKIRQKLQKYVLGALHTVERRVGHFLPYAISERRNGELCKRIEGLLREESIRTILIVGAAPGSKMTEAVLEGELANENLVTVVCVGETVVRFMFDSKSAPGDPTVKVYRPSSSSPRRQWEELGCIPNTMIADNRIDHFDAVLIEGWKPAGEKSISDFPSGIINAARLVILSDINSDGIGTVYQELLGSDGYDLIDYNLESSGGYAVFQRQVGMKIDEDRKLFSCPNKED
jgi:tetratricopeptide (TPR) repeat protein